MADKIEIKEVVKGETKNKMSVFWGKQLDNAKNNHKYWLKESRKYYNIYYNTDDNYGYSSKFNSSYGSKTNFSNAYNLFYSNVETKRPLLFSKLPELDIRRRNDKKDRVSRISSEMLERNCNFFLENYGAEIGFKKAILDKEITGRGLIRLVFETGLVEGEIENEEGEIETIQAIDPNLKKIKTDFVPYDMFLIEPAKKWEDVNWISFTHQMGKSEVAKRFGKKKAEDIKYTETTLDTPPDNDEIDNDDESELKVLAMRTIVYEIWDKQSRKIFFYSPQEKKILDTIDDNYNLQNFFPIPRPLGLLSNNRSLIPAPSFRQYRDKYEELQDVDERLRNLVSQARVCYVASGIASEKDVDAMMNKDDGFVTFVKAIDPKGSLKDKIVPKDLIPIINAITVLTARQQQIIQDIREITGLSDIIRGSTDPRETASAQKIKGDFAVSRLQLEQQEIEYFVRDVLRIQCELIAENYTAEELAKISGLNVIDVKAIAQRTQQQAIAQSQQQGLNEEQEEKLIQQLTQQTIQQIQKQLKTTFSCTKDELAQIDNLIKDDKLRDFNIDIETESTVKMDNDIEKAQRIEFLNVVSETLTKLAPLKQTGLITEDALKGLLAFSIRPFKVGRSLEEALLEKQDTTERDKREAKLQEAQLKMEMEERVILPNRKADIEEKKVDGDLSIKKVEIESKELQTEVESDTDIAVAEINAEARKESKNNQKEEK